MYWASQWERNSQLEDQRLSVSNFVVAGSVVALGIFAAGSTASTATAWILASAVAAANLVALGYSARSEQWARLHKARARWLVEDNWDYLADLQERVDNATSRPHGPKSPSRRLALQTLIHLLLAGAAIALAIWG